ncbi:MAG: hypothetical protein RBT63_04735 [Bdellovibrionales bacterium]|jgi:hypothetical protein|nr:hypothetical protein [Bdellovibrionales bacterium]
MKRQLRLAAVIGLISYFGACAPVKFDVAAEDDSKGDPSVAVRCEGSECFYDVTEERTVGQGLVDILIVNDNSGSMLHEQQKMASAFAGFLGQLESRDLNYQIAMTTTDVTGSNGGALLSFGSSGLKVLKNSTPNNVGLFNETIQRSETASGDERGIYAAKLAIEKYRNQFMRPTAHLAVIVLSDEDEGSVSEYNKCDGFSGNGMLSASQVAFNNCGWMKDLELANTAFRGMPDKFVDSFRSIYPNKTMSWHSIVVSSHACRNEQSMGGGTFLGQIGAAYIKLSQMTGGIVGNICASNYTSQLTDIGYSIGEKVVSLPFRCRPVGDTYQVLYGGQPASSGTYSADFNAMTLSVNASLAPGTKITLKYACMK